MSETSTSPRLSPTKLFLGIGLAVCLAVSTAVLAFRNRGEDPSWARVHADLATVSAALEKYHEDHGSYPEENDTLEVLVPKYLPALPVDPWGREYIYENNGKKPLILTFGNDGERGGMGDEQDHHQYDGHLR
jgi:general secretion pathway protein G